MSIIEEIKNRAKKNLKTIILPEAYDLSILKSAEITTTEGFAKIILLGNEEKINNLAKENNIDIKNTTIINPYTFKDTPHIINEFYKLRKEKGITLEEATKIMIKDYNYFANMLVKLGYADGVTSGKIHSSADTLRPALQILKTKENTKLVSSFFLIEVPNYKYREDNIFIYSDCGMIQNPTSEQLVEIAKSSAETYEQLLEKKAKVALLSHSTYNSSKCQDVEKVKLATQLTKELYPDILVDGELQLDAAIVPEVAKIKAPNSKVAGFANVLIFPDLDAGNIAYKITERMANANAYGPLTQGIKKPSNDLSRGSTVEDIVGTIAITAVQAQEN